MQSSSLSDVEMADLSNCINQGGRGEEEADLEASGSPRGTEQRSSTSSSIFEDHPTLTRTLAEDMPGCGSDGEESTPRQNDNATELSWMSAYVVSPDGKKTLLRDACGRVKGRFLAIMGPSGAGKTTLLNLLAGRVRLGKVKGTKMMMDGYTYNTKDLKNLSGYVMQDDLLFPYLTVWETLRYAALLRLPPTMSNSEKLERVDSVICKLGLRHCANTWVGDPLKRGISGGERKRLCVGIELLSQPKILFLDEPTSGLDSVTALMLCKVLRDLAHSEGCTIVCTIHQPSTKIFNSFDDLMVLKEGRIVYHGAVAEVLDFYAHAGFPCPRHTNPADHVLDVITPTAFTPAAIEEANANAEALINQYEPIEVEEPKQGKLKSQVKFPARPPWGMQFLYLFQRSMRNTLRARSEMLAQLLQTIIMAILIGGVFFQIGDNLESTTRRQPVLFFVCINQGIFGALILINSFPSERLIVLRERSSGMYSVSAYFLAKISIELLVQLIYPIIFSTIVYWMVGLQADAGKFIVFMLFMELCSLTATSLALMISTLCRTVSLAITMLPITMEVCRLFGGFFLPPAKLPSYFSWLDALSFVKYTYVGISLNELEGLEIHCDQDELSENGTCSITSGQQTIDKLGLDFISIWGCALVLLAMILVSRFTAYCALRWERQWEYLTFNNLIYTWKKLFAKS
ncbi:ABC2 type transporter superfamily protein [Balamuthia mandrillaris]